jgi:hypothetical protein
MTLNGTLPTDRRRSLILDLVAKYTYKILSANVCFVGPSDIKYNVSTGRFGGKRDRQNQFFRTTAILDGLKLHKNSELTI